MKNIFSVSISVIGKIMTVWVKVKNSTKGFCRSTVGRLSSVSWLTGRLSAVSRPTVGRLSAIGRLLVDKRSQFAVFPQFYSFSKTYTC